VAARTLIQEDFPSRDQVFVRRRKRIGQLWRMSPDRSVTRALVIEMLPAQLLLAPVTIGGIILVALVSAFLPVPMAFDVAIAYIAMTKGVPLPSVVTILCTLGIISVFSLFVLGNSISWKIAAVAYSTIVVLGTLAGVLARGFS